MDAPGSLVVWLEGGWCNGFRAISGEHGERFHSLGQNQTRHPHTLVPILQGEPLITPLDCLHCLAASCSTDWQLVAILEVWCCLRCSIDISGSLARLIHMCHGAALLPLTVAACWAVWMSLAEGMVCCYSRSRVTGNCFQSRPIAHNVEDIVSLLSRMDSKTVWAVALDQSTPPFQRCWWRVLRLNAIPATLA